MQPKVSVIIPVYNNEKYLRQCLNSVAEQTLHEMQVILINDGSKDRSGEICQEYANKYENFEYYSQKNGGSAAARNSGIDHATGEYIGFVDSDDWVEPDMYERLYTVARENNEADIVFCRVFEDETPGSYEYVMPRTGYYNSEELKKEIFPFMMPHVTEKGNFRSIRWSNVLRIYKKSIIDQHHIRSCEGVSNCEDLGFNIECTIHSSSYYYLNECLYHNRPNPASQSRNYVINMWPRTRKLVLDMRRFISVYDTVDLVPAFYICTFYFFTMIIRNEMRINNVQTRKQNIQKMLNDSICLEIMNVVTNKGMNSEFRGIYLAVKTGSASQVIRYMKKLNFKKEKLFPFLGRIISLPGINKAYKVVRYRG